MAGIRVGVALRGRHSQRAVLDQLLEAARGGKRSGVLVLRGEAGIGKTPLLDYLLERSHGCRVARAVGGGNSAGQAALFLARTCTGRASVGTSMTCDLSSDISRSKGSTHCRRRYDDPLWYT